jgi:hypothetical protein
VCVVYWYSIQQPLHRSGTDTSNLGRRRKFRVQGSGFRVQGSGSGLVSVLTPHRTGTSSLGRTCHVHCSMDMLSSQLWAVHRRIAFFLAYIYIVYISIFIVTPAFIHGTCI